MDRHEIAAQNTTTLEQRWNLVKGQEYLVDQGIAGFIGIYRGSRRFTGTDGREFYVMPAQVREIHSVRRDLVVYWSPTIGQFVTIPEDRPYDDEEA